MIGVFDSGSGGLSVLRAIRERAPLADVVYFGDLQHVPYGNKTREELDVLTTMGVRLLLEYGATEIVSACNSIAVSAKGSCAACGVPYANMIEMVEPTAEYFSHTNAHVLLLATKATIASAIYEKHLHAKNIKVDSCAVPDLVDLIEKGASFECLKRMVCATLKDSLQGTHTHIILGCTHFPLIRYVFEKVLAKYAPYVTLIDPAEYVAKEVEERFDTQGSGTVRVLVSARSAVFESFFTSLFPHDVANVEVI